MSITRKEKRESDVIPERKKDMTTMNRFNYLDSERHYEATLDSIKEWGLMFMRSSEIKQIRGNCYNRCKCR